jgi:formate dehydrogenase subunit delta
MNSTTDTLVRMANDIGKFFRVQGEDRAVAGVAEHVKKFWEPRMKLQIFAHLDHGGSGLEPIPLKALQTLKTAMHGKSTAAEAAAAAATANGGAAPAQPAKAKVSGGAKRR